MADVELLQEACQELEQLHSSWGCLQSQHQHQQQQMLVAEGQGLSQAQCNALAAQTAKKQAALLSALAEVKGLKEQLVSLQSQVGGTGWAVWGVWVWQGCACRVARQHTLRRMQHVVSCFSCALQPPLKLACFSATGAPASHAHLSNTWRSDTTTMAWHACMLLLMCDPH